MHFIDKHECSHSSISWSCIIIYRNILCLRIPSNDISRYIQQRKIEALPTHLPAHLHMHKTHTFSSAAHEPYLSGPEWRGCGRPSRTAAASPASPLLSMSCPRPASSSRSSSKGKSRAGESNKLVALESGGGGRGGESGERGRGWKEGGRRGGQGEGERQRGRCNQEVGARPCAPHQQATFPSSSFLSPSPKPATPRYTTRTCLPPRTQWAGERASAGGRALSGTSRRRGSARGQRGRAETVCIGARRTGGSGCRDPRARLLPLQEEEEG